MYVQFVDRSRVLRGAFCRPGPYHPGAVEGWVVGLYRSCAGLYCAFRPPLNLWSQTWVSSSMGNGQIRFVARTTGPDDVLMVAVRTIASFPGCVSMTTPIRQHIGWRLSSRSRTGSPGFTSVLAVRFHFFLCCSVFRNSPDQRFQKLCACCWTRCHRDRRFSFTIVTSSSTEVVNFPPMRKCPGVKAVRSLGSEDNGVRDWELMHASICVKSV